MISGKTTFYKKHPVIEAFYLIGCLIFLSGIVIKAYRLYYWLKHGIWLKKYIWELITIKIIDDLANWETWIGFKQLILWITQWIILCDVSDFLVFLGGALFGLMIWLDLNV
jgi:hypothetical protein